MFEQAAVPAIEKALQSLLEGKHLYQSVEVNVKELTSAIEERTKNELSLQVQALPSLNGGIGPARFRNRAQILEDFKEKAEECLRHSPYFLRSEGPLVRIAGGAIVISLPTVKTYCQNCDGLWPHNPLPDIPFLENGVNVVGDQQQLLLLRYQCQSCKKEPMAFLVKRDGIKLSLCGRSPMEEIDCPKFIPKEVKKYYCGAVIAYNSRALLPAIFMLRTMIEQHMRSAIAAGNRKMTGDELTEAYASTLHEDFKRQQYQSLKPVYESLSDAIHSAKDDDPQCFEDQRTKVLAHFEGKEVFERLSNSRKKP